MCYQSFRKESALFTTKTRFSNEFPQHYLQESFNGDTFVNQPRFDAYASSVKCMISIIITADCGSLLYLSDSTSGRKWRHCYSLTPIRSWERSSIMREVFVTLRRCYEQSRRVPNTVFRYFVGWHVWNKEKRIFVKSIRPHGLQASYLILGMTKMLNILIRLKLISFQEL